MLDIYGLDEVAGTWRQKAAALAADVVARHATDVDTLARFPSESMAALAQGGFYGLCIDVRFGGQGQGPAAFAAVVEELARHCGSTAMVYVMHIAATKVIETSVTLPTRADVLRSIAAGKHLTTFALSERGSRSQFWAPVSQLVEQGNDYRTDAFKSWSTAAHHADSYVASAQRPGAQSPLDFTLYLLPRTRPGVQHPGAFNGLGLRGNDSAPVQLEGVVVRQEESADGAWQGPRMCSPDWHPLVQRWFDRHGQWTLPGGCGRHGASPAGYRF